MPGCVLRASGAKFDVDSFLKTSPFKADVIYRKGQRRRPASRGAQTASGFNVAISDSDDPQVQVEKALAFVRKHHDELLRLVRFGGIEDVILDFACPQKEFVARTARLPGELLTAAGALGMDVQVSFYLVA
ncbi:MAG TPA: hypothetical protein VII12_05410 [Thermoanaerobaculia bacterium]|jgi:hypothetical protein